MTTPNMTAEAPDLTGGYAPELDLVLPQAPADPEMRESTSFWAFDDSGEFGFPRWGIEAVGSEWNADRMFQANFAFADGRVLDGAGRGDPPSPIGPDGRPTVIGAGPLVFRCIEPFRRWKVTFDGTAADGHVTDQILQRFDRSRRTPARLEFEMAMVTPPWEQGAMLPDAAKALEGVAGDLMGRGFRVEHLFLCEGSYEIDGRMRPFKGRGLRIHRKGVRQLAGFWGHCWQSAVFASGRAFGYIAYPPREGKESYNEGYIYQDGRMIPARAVEPPWLSRIMSRGDDVSLELESELGRTAIEGETTLCTFRVGNPDIGGLDLQQSGVLYRWDGESAYGMIERSFPGDQTVKQP